ncbi:hypothetical protein DPMN_186569 [Dreissena polymorpha]|uniref:Uncharacterized protein n=1 Tax=Dreissena polymorpha TaxID=45954 RepID=A0A9D4I6M2_DREPO|nr:hypothetical protein DPMN_186569 [Dreissena polymorpha]
MYFVGKLNELLVHNLISLAICAVAFASFIWTSAVLVPSLERFPMYLKFGTYSS